MRQFQSVLGLPLGSRGMQDFSPCYTKQGEYTFIVILVILFSLLV